MSGNPFHATRMVRGRPEDHRCKPEWESPANVIPSPRSTKEGIDARASGIRPFWRLPKVMPDSMEAGQGDSLAAENAEPLNLRSRVPLARLAKRSELVATTMPAKRRGRAYPPAVLELLQPLDQDLRIMTEREGSHG